MLSRRVASPSLVVLLVLGACTATPAGPSPLIGDPSCLEAHPGDLLVLGEDGASSSFVRMGPIVGTWRSPK